MHRPLSKIHATLFSTVIFLGCRADARAHGSLHEQIAAATVALEKKPGDFELLLLRARLHRQHQDWEAAQRDIAAADEAGAGAGALALARAEVAEGRADWDAAARELPVLARELPENAEAWRLAGRVHSALGRHVEAAAAWRAVAKTATPSRPDDIVSLARALQTGGAHDEALAALAGGSHRLGEISVFLEEAAPIEESRNRWEAALIHVERLIASSPNPVRWLARKGDVAERAGRPDIALTARRAALTALEKLPPARRETPAFSELEKRLRAALPDSAFPASVP